MRADAIRHGEFRMTCSARGCRLKAVYRCKIPRTSRNGFKHEVYLSRCAPHAESLAARHDFTLPPRLVQ